MKTGTRFFSSYFFFFFFFFFFFQMSEEKTEKSMELCISKLSEVLDTRIGESVTSIEKFCIICAFNGASVDSKFLQRFFFKTTFTL